MKNLDEFVSSMQGRVIRFYKYKKVWTPYELDKKFMDESMYEDDYGKTVYINDYVILPNNDVLLKMEMVTDSFINDYEEADEKEQEEDKVYYYEKLSDIVLCEYDSDN